MDIEKKPKVSVCMITYNHEPYIAQAIEGVLMQETDFPIELVIGEDCSPDATRKICEDYARRHPEIIKLLPSDRNLGIKPNFVRTLRECKGKYLAICEGDDYWTNTKKLQKQVYFLEQNPQYSLVCGNAEIINEITGTKRIARKTSHSGHSFNQAQMLMDNQCVTLTVLIRNNLPEKLPDIFFRETGLDRQLWLLSLNKGNGFFFNEIWGIYRKHPGGITHRPATYENIEETYLTKIRIAKEWNLYLGNKYNKEVKQVRFLNGKKLLKLAMKNRRFSQILPYIKHMLP